MLKVHREVSYCRNRYQLGTILGGAMKDKVMTSEPKIDPNFSKYRNNDGVRSEDNPLGQRH